MSDLFSRKESQLSFSVEFFHKLGPGFQSIGFVALNGLIWDRADGKRNSIMIILGTYLKQMLKIPKGHSLSFVFID